MFPVAGWVEMFIGVIDAVVALFIPAPGALFRRWLQEQAVTTRAHPAVWNCFTNLLFCIFHICREQYSGGNFIDERTLGEWRVFLSANFEFTDFYFRTSITQQATDERQAFLWMWTYPLKVKLHIIHSISDQTCPVFVSKLNFPGSFLPIIVMVTWSVGQKIQTICYWSATFNFHQMRIWWTIIATWSQWARTSLTNFSI